MLVSFIKSKKFICYFLVAILTVSIILNLIFYLVEIHPLVLNKLHKEKYTLSINASEHKKLIVNAGLRMNLSRETLMRFDDHSTFFNELRKLKNSHKEKIFKEYNYLKGFLVNGLLDYGIKRNDPLILNQIPDILNNYIDGDGKLVFDLNKIDQAVFGLAFIKAEQFTHHKEYRKGIDSIYKFLKHNLNKEHNIILYRPADDHQFVDALGMICPFLVKYGTTYHDTVALGLANKEILYYIKNGLESTTHFPFHAIELDHNLKLGPATWGRGIGWYAIALAYNLHYTNKNNNPYYLQFENEMNILYTNLKKLQYHDSWGQFINGDESEQVDTSTTALLLLAFNLAGKENFTDNKIAKIFKRYTTTDGYIDFTSGDTLDLNRYSTKFGKSELTQGLLLSLYGNATD